MKKVIYFMSLFFVVLIMFMPVKVYAADIIQVSTFEELKTELARNTTSTIKIVSDYIKTTSKESYLDVKGNHILDLNGASLSKYYNGNEYEFIRVYGSLTIKNDNKLYNSKINFDTGFYDSSKYSSVIKVENNGKLVIDDSLYKILITNMNDKYNTSWKTSINSVIYAAEGSSVTINGGEYTGYDNNSNIEALYAYKNSDVIINSGKFWGAIKLLGNFHISSLDLNYPSRAAADVGYITTGVNKNIWSGDYIDSKAQIYEDGVLVSREPSNGMNHGGDSNDTKYMISANHIEIKNNITIKEIEMYLDSYTFAFDKSLTSFPNIINGCKYCQIDKIEYFDEDSEKYVKFSSEWIAGHYIMPIVTFKAADNYIFDSNVLVMVTSNDGQGRSSKSTISDNGKTLIANFPSLQVLDYGISKNVSTNTIYREISKNGNFYLDDEHSFELKDNCHSSENVNITFWYKGEYGVNRQNHYLNKNTPIQIDRPGEYECWFTAEFPYNTKHPNVESNHFTLIVKEPFKVYDAKLNITVHKGQNTILNARATGSGLKYSWKKTDGSIVDYGDHPYYIYTDTFNESGTYIYTCTVSDIEGKTYTFTYNITVDDETIWDKDKYYPMEPKVSLEGNYNYRFDSFTNCNIYDFTLYIGDSLDLNLIYDLERVDRIEQSNPDRQPAVDDLTFTWKLFSSDFATFYGVLSDSLSCKYIAEQEGLFTIEGSVKNVLPSSPNNMQLSDSVLINITVLKEAPSFSITSDSSISNGLIKFSTNSAKAGDIITVMPSPASGYVLNSIWVKSKTDESDIPINTDNQFIMPEDDVTVYASFTPILYCSISFKGGNDTSGTVPEKIIAEQNSMVRLPKNSFVKKGYAFIGWSDGSYTYLADSSYLVPFNDSVVFEAVWQALPVYKLTFSGGSGTSGTAPKEITGNEKEKITLPKNTFTKKGYKFVGWNDKSKTYKAGASYTIPDNNVSFTAKWEKLPVYTLTFSGGSGTTGTAPSALSGNEKEKITLPKNTFTKKGYKFIGWSDGSKTYKEGASYTIPANNVKFTAKWQKNASTKRDLIEQFVERMYTKALGRSAEPDGLKYWADRLEQLTDDGANVAYGFITSDEFVKRKLSDDQFVETMYQTFFGRASDTEGKKYWLKKIKDGASRKMVLAGFVKSDEFGNLCSKAGIDRGVILEDGTPVNAGIYRFVKRQYTCCLQREGEREGIDYWAVKIAGHEVSAVDVAKEFFFSKEFEAKGLNDKQYVERLYETFLGRPFDEVGYAYWNDKMSKGESRKDILNEFASSAEFQEILKSFGL